MPADFGGLGLEQRVEDRDHPLARQPVGTLGKTAQVRRPQHGGQRHSGAAADLTGQNFGPGIGAEISAEQVVGDPPLIVPVGGDREAPTDTRQIGQFVVAKPVGPIGDKGQHVSGGINAIDRQGDIVGAAALAQFDQHLEIELVVWQVETPP